MSLISKVDTTRIWTMATSYGTDGDTHNDEDDGKGHDEGVDDGDNNMTKSMTRRRYMVIKATDMMMRMTTKGMARATRITITAKMTKGTMMILMVVKKIASRKVTNHQHYLVYETSQGGKHVFQNVF